MGTYYKFRSLQNFKRFLDILANDRLYASVYNKLNDPMEGAYKAFPGLSPMEKDQIRQGKSNIRICSLTTAYKSSIMWSHYADEHRGCCIKVEVSGAEPVNYCTELLTINDIDTAEKILMHKSVMWQQEEEYRILLKGHRNNPFVNVKIQEIIFGLRVEQDEFDKYKYLISKIDPNIKVWQIKREELDNGFTD